MMPGREIVVWVVAAIATLLFIAFIGYLLGGWHELSFAKHLL